MLKVANNVILKITIYKIKKRKKIRADYAYSVKIGRVVHKGYRRQNWQSAKCRGHFMQSCLKKIHISVLPHMHVLGGLGQLVSFSKTHQQIDPYDWWQPGQGLWTQNSDTLIKRCFSLKSACAPHQQFPHLETHHCLDKVVTDSKGSASLVGELLQPSMCDRITGKCNSSKEGGIKRRDQDELLTSPNFQERLVQYFRHSPSEWIRAENLCMHKVLVATLCAIRERSWERREGRKTELYLFELHYCKCISYSVICPFADRGYELRNLCCSSNFQSWCPKTHDTYGHGMKITHVSMFYGRQLTMEPYTSLLKK